MIFAKYMLQWPVGLAIALALLIGKPLAAHEAHLHGKGAAEPYTRSVGHYRVPGVTLVDQGGAPVLLTEELSRPEPIILQFVFTTCPTVCPILTHTMSATQETHGPGMGDVRLVSITIDPEYDTPERLSAYARDVGAGDGWRFLTGDLADVVAVQKAFDAYEGNKMRHVALTFLKTDTGGPWVRFEGFITPDELLVEYRNLTKPR